jgi:putative adhesin
VRAAKIGLLCLILLFGAGIETAWQVRENIGIGPMGCQVLGGRLYGASFVFQSNDERPVAAGGAVEVQNAFGDVTVRAGEPGKVTVSLRKVVFRPKEEEARAFADRLRIVAREESGRLVITTNREDLERERPEGRQVGFETHLEVSVPPDTPLTVRAEHGGIDASGVAQADLAGSFKSVKAERIGGPLKIDVHHGGATVREIGGTLTLTGTHGTMAVEDVKGAVSIQTEHASLKLARLGPATLSTTHGDITVDGVAGDLEARTDKGGIEADHVAGSVVASATYADVEVRHVDGEARLRAEHGGVEAEDVLGPLVAEASHSNVRLLRIGKDAQVTVEHGGVDGRGLAGAVRVKSHGDDVSLEGFASAVDVDVERGSVDLSPAGAITHQVTVRSQHGGITLRVPSGSDLDLEADVQPGDLDVDLPGFAADRSTESSTAGRVGKGGVAVKLTASHGDVRVHHAARDEDAEARDASASASPAPDAAASSAPPPAPIAPRAPRVPSPPAASPATSPETSPQG